MSEENTITEKSEIEKINKILQYAGTEADDNTVEEFKKNFAYPDMGDYYINAVDNTYLKLIADHIAENDDEINKAFFYQEAPVVDEYRLHPDLNIAFIKVKIDPSMSVLDGDTLSIPIDKVSEADDETMSIIQKGALIPVSTALKKSASFAIRFTAIDAPEIPKFAEDTINIKSVETKSATLEEAKQYGYIYEKAKKRESNIANFIKIGNSWCEYEEKSEIDSNKKIIRWVMNDNSSPSTSSQGLKAKEILTNLLEKANGEVSIIVDQTQVNNLSAYYKRKYDSNPYGSDIENYLKLFLDEIFDENQYSLTGYNQYGQDAYRRFLGTPYVKIGGQWINVQKYLISELEAIEINPILGSTALTTAFKYSSSAHKLETYDYYSNSMDNAIWDTSKQFDDRATIQKEIFGIEFEAMKDWTVTIGDATLFVPPTSIQCLTQTTAERMPLIRAKGSMTKSSQKSERFIELNLYFNEEYGINGYPYKTNLPNGEEITYYMNGLRALIAQFKVTPFLPIENHYINNVLNIEAVSMIGMQINTVSGYPKLLQASITLQEFNYRVYLPELPVRRDEDNSFRNYFSTTINFQTMRYYYQKLIINGETLQQLGHDFNSDSFNNAFSKIGTALFPMQWKDSNIKFYIANEDHLKKMLHTKMAEMARSSTIPALTDNEAEMANNLSTFFECLSKEIGSGIRIVEDEQILAINNLSEGSISFGALETSTSGTVFLSKKSPEDKILQAINNAIVATNASLNKIFVKNARKNLTDVVLLNVASANDDIENDEFVKSATCNFLIDVDITMKRDELEQLLANASIVLNKTVDTIFIGNTLQLQVTFDFDKFKNIPVGGWANKYSTTDKEYYTINTSSTDYGFLAYCYTQSLNSKDRSGDVINTKQLLDVETEETIKFEHYDVGEILINSFSVSMNNTYAHIGVSALDGDAPQYLGGQDSLINIEMYTQSEKTAALLSQLPKISSLFARDYKLVLPCWPLRLESEIMQFMGLRDTMIETVLVSTVDGYPGLFKIDLRLVSVDKTLRNREALDTVATANGGIQNTIQQASRQTKDYFDLKKTLSKIDIYPDLELPTIEELSSKGFKFVRYKFQPDRIYPDPDFYFIYAHLLSSQVYRETILNIHKTNATATTFVDESGASVLSEVSNTGNAVEITAENDIAKEQKKLTLSAQKIIEETNENKQNQTKDSETEKEINENFLLTPKKQQEKENKKLTPIENFAAIALQKNAMQSWDLGKNIKCFFLEDNYLKSIESINWTRQEKDEDNWIYNSLENSRIASRKIKEMLEYSGVAKTYISSSWTDTGNYKALNNYITAQPFLKEIFELLNIDKSQEKFYETVSTMIYCAACAATGNREYNDSSSKDWKFDKKRLGIKRETQQNLSGEFVIYDNINDAIENAVSFGPFDIKMYTKNEIENILGVTVKEKNATNKLKVNQTLYLLDPFYMYADEETIKEYKKNCIENYSYAAQAFFRNVLVWLKILIDKNLFPSISMDYLRKVLKTESSIQEKVKEVTGENKKALLSHIKLLLEKNYVIDNGKFFAAIVMALTSGNAGILDMMIKREYSALNSYISSCTQVNTINRNDITSITIRKFILAFIGTNLIDGIKSITEITPNPASQHFKTTVDKLYLDAAENPETFIPHSFYDMVINDFRGRMLRAFPVIYMLFIDEGREYGAWKLSDSFYNTSAISEMQITKSRKIASDIATITMSNMFKTFTAEDEDSSASYTSSIKDVWTSIFSPKDHVEKLEREREKSKDYSRIRIRPGARLHIRMGYGANASTLPVVFNGTIVESHVSDAITILAQGDGIELTRDILNLELADNAEYFNDLTSNIQGKISRGASPKEIIDSLLTMKGSWLAEKLKNTDYGYMFNNNPFGIYHFGNPDFKDIFHGGEVTQNIYEGVSTPKWASENRIAEMYSDKAPPKLTFPIFGKTVWDATNICKTASPDFVCGVAPFGFRSTLFHGSPRFYAAYEYNKIDGTTIEKRKPYSQYHIYTAFTDIMKNNITMSSKNVKTCAVGLYSDNLGQPSNRRLDPMWVDSSIYPEEQQTMICDTQLYAKGLFVTNWIADNISGSIGGFFKSNEKLAWRMTANMLKDTVKEMYQEDLILIGDPTVKPHDRILLDDFYENMNGQCTVREVVHNFSIENGFTTSVFPDCIVTVDDPFEKAAQQVGTTILGISGFINTGLIYVSTKLFGGAPAVLGSALNSIKTKATGVLTGETITKWVGEGAVKSMIESTKEVGSVFNRFKGTVVSGTYTSTASSLAVRLAPWLINAVIVAAIYGTGKYIINWFERFARNQRVVEIFPIKRYGVTMTAGMSGSKGVIYGSPSYQQSGLITTLYSNLAAASENPVLRACQEWFMSEEMMRLGEKYKANNKIVGLDGQPADSQQKVVETIKNITGARKELERNYRSMRITPRAALDDKKEIDIVLEKYSAKNLNSFLNGQTIDEYLMISQAERLKSYIKNDFFRIVHENGKIQNVDKNVEFIKHDIGGGFIEFTAFVGKNKDGSKYHDIPFLHKDAIHVLINIIERTYNNLYSTKISKDRIELYKLNKNNFVTLKSALRVGGKQSYTDTGFMFALEGIGEAKEHLEKAIIEYREEIEKNAKENELYNKDVFKTILDDKTGVITFFVYLPSANYIKSKEPSE